MSPSGATMNPNPEIVHLENAMAEGDLFAVRRLVAKGIDPDTVLTGTSFTALTRAIILGKYELVQTLLDVGANPNLPDSRGEVPLNWACDDGDKEMCEILLASGADPFRVNSEGKNAFWIACRKEHYDLFDELCKWVSKGKPCTPVGTNSPLSLAASYGRSKAIVHLLDGGLPLGGKDSDGATALHRAAGKGHVACISILLDRGAVVDAVDEDGLTPLDYACMSDLAEIAELLIECGASVNSVDCLGNTPLHVCAAFGSSKCARVLLRHRADVNVRRRDNATPLELMKGDLEAWLASKGGSGLLNEDDRRPG
jgi:FOG: Ankyrin repeat